MQCFSEGLGRASRRDQAAGRRELAASLGTARGRADWQGGRTIPLAARWWPGVISSMPPRACRREGVEIGPSIAGLGLLEVSTRENKRALRGA